MKQVFNCATQEIKIIELTETELTQVKSMQEKEKIFLAEAEAKAQAKATAEAKLAALGLTTDDLKALGL